MVQRNSQPRRRSPGKLATTGYVGEVIDYIDGNKPPIETGQVDDGLRHGPPRWIKISASSKDGSNFRWTYTAKLAYRVATGFGAWVVEGNNITAYNSIEQMNSSSGVMGNGVDTANLAGTSLELQPAPAGAIVLATFEFDAWVFSYENGVDGACE